MVHSSNLSSAEMRESARGGVRRAGFSDSLKIFADVILPTVAKGVIVRRPFWVAVAERFDLDGRAIRRMQRIRGKYGSTPLIVPVPGRSLALILDPKDVHRILAESPEPFATATWEKRAALSHFEPRNVLISSGSERVERRRYNEAVLDTNSRVHRLAEGFLDVVTSEIETLFTGRPRHGLLDWKTFADTWFRIVRRIVFGESARDDQRISAVMAQLRSNANWAFLAPHRTALRDELFARIRRYLSQAAPNSLAGAMASTDSGAQTAPEQQVPQWLFAFDPAGMATFRTLALLASHPAYARRVREEIGARSHERLGRDRSDLPALRAAVLECLRLWPTTPFLLRESTVATEWESGVLPAHTSILIYTPFFHRDGERLPFAHQFEPELWMTRESDQERGLVPFSDGPAMCPGRHVVQFLASATIAAILERVRLRLKAPACLRAGAPLPAELNHFRLKFEYRSD
jgi:cytochrome P450